MAAFPPQFSLPARLDAAKWTRGKIYYISTCRSIALPRMLWPVTQNETPGLGARARAHACVASQRGLKKNLASRDTWARVTKDVEQRAGMTRGERTESVG
jgi:hypothetical protein